ncbi:hypothetical protein [Pseudomonas sp. OV226]|uniref:hypothetical protein n=1 Tax=Pseudomonas sp. OV226 TaxID=2135588 RepID=UPI0011B25194|nr:hypothetical protein [Pseudomonas sp. OV226]
MEKDVSTVEKALESLTPVKGSLVAVTEAWPHSDWFTEQTAKVALHRATYQKKLDALLTEMRNDFSTLFSENQQWREITMDLDAAHSNFITACAAKGVQPSDVSRLQELDRTRQRGRQRAAVEVAGEDARRVGAISKSAFRDLGGAMQVAHAGRIGNHGKN